MERDREMFRYAYTQSPFYQALLDRKKLSVSDLMKNWERIPVVDKRQMLSAKESVLPLSSCDFFGESKMMYKLAADDAGVCLQVAWTQRDLASYLSPLWECRRRFYGIGQGDRSCSFRLYPDKKQTDLTLNRDFEGSDLSFSVLNLTRKRVEGMYKVIQQYRPRWLLIQPSVACIFADYILESGAKSVSSLTCIELMGEYVTDAQRKHIEEAFGCKTAYVFYTDEMNAVAYECPKGKLHLLEENVLVEVMNGDQVLPDGEEGELVLTCLSNTVMPFVRYRIGIRGKILPDTCNCGNTSRILELAEKRENELIQMENDIDIPPYEFTYAFRCAAGIQEIDLLQYQVEQTGCHSYIVTIAMNNKSKASDQEIQKKVTQTFLSNIVYDYIKDSIYTFRFQDTLLPQGSADGERIFWTFTEDEN